MWWRREQERKRADTGGTRAMLAPCSSSSSSVILVPVRNPRPDHRHHKAQHPPFPRPLPGPLALGMASKGDWGRALFGAVTTIAAGWGVMKCACAREGGGDGVVRAPKSASVGALSSRLQQQNDMLTLACPSTAVASHNADGRRVLRQAVPGAQEAGRSSPISRGEANGVR